MRIRKFTYLSIIAMLVLVLAGCGSSSQQESPEPLKTQPASTQPAKELTKEEFAQMIVNGADNLKGSKVEFYAKAFNATSIDGKQHIQAYTDIKNRDKSIMIESDYKTSEDEYIHVTGTVSGTATGTNAFGGKISAPIIRPTTIEKASYIDAVSPSKKTIDLNKDINQHGLVVRLQKIEIAENETRLYFEVTNNSKGKASFYSFNSKLIQGDKQFEEENNYDADYKDIQSELLPGIKSDGIIAFEPINPSLGKVTVISEARSDDYMLKFSPYTFDVTW